MESILNEMYNQYQNAKHLYGEDYITITEYERILGRILKTGIEQYEEKL